MAGWDCVLDDMLLTSQVESELAEDADAARSESDAEESPVPRSPQSSDSSYIHAIKTATRSISPKGLAQKRSILLVSNCTAAFSEAVALKARDFV